MHHPTDRIAHTTSFATPVVEHWLEQEIAEEKLNMCARMAWEQPRSQSNRQPVDCYEG